MGEHLALKDLYRLVHDIKTPVNTITGRLQMALARVEEPRARTDLVHGAAGALNLLRKFYNLYDVVSVLNDPSYPERKPADVAAAWNASWKKWKVAAEAASVNVAASIPPDLLVALRADIFTRIFDNLVSNALLHSQGCGLISVKAELSGDKVSILVRNDGFDGDEGPLEPMEPDFTEGLTINHLGLAAVRLIVERVGGDFSARGTAAGAFIVSFSLPSE